MAKTSYEERPENWNMMLAFLQRLDKRLDERDTAARQGDLLQWYRVLGVIFRNIEYKFRQLENSKRAAEFQQEKERVDTLFLQAKDVLAQRPSVSVISHAEEKLQKLDYAVNTLIWKFDLLEPKFKSGTIEEMMDDDFSN